MSLTRSNGGAMTMRLEPESLGTLRVQMQMSQGRVSVRFQAETPQARALLQQNVDALRAGLESKGLMLEQVHVQPLMRAFADGGFRGGESGTNLTQDQGRSFASAGPNGGPSSQQQQSRQDAGGERSRGFEEARQRWQDAAHANRHRPRRPAPTP